jgi:hypothetical protein
MDSDKDDSDNDDTTGDSKRNGTANGNKEEKKKSRVDRSIGSKETQVPTASLCSSLISSHPVMLPILGVGRATRTGKRIEETRN